MDIDWMPEEGGERDAWLMSYGGSIYALIFAAANYKLALNSHGQMGGVTQALVATAQRVEITERYLRDRLGIEPPFNSLPKRIMEVRAAAVKLVRSTTPAGTPNTVIRDFVDAIEADF